MLSLSDGEWLWAQREMACAKVTHGKERRSLAVITAKLASRSDLSFSSAVGNAARQAAHRLFAKEQITPQGLLQGHFEQTAERIRQQKTPGSLVLIAQDTMVVDLSTHRSVVGLGPISDGGFGSFAHSALCCTEEGLPLGVIDLLLWARDPDQPAGRKDKRKKPYSQKESFKWTSVLIHVQERIAPEQPVMLIQDREADIFAFIAQPRRSTVSLLIRASEPRNVQVTRNVQVISSEQAVEAQDGSRKISVDTREISVDTMSLFEAIGCAPELGTYEIVVARRPNQTERTATLALRAQAVSLPAPQSGHKEDPKQAQSVWVVQASEQNAPQGVPPIAWTLISTMPVTNAEEARQMVIRYTRRWVIERLHYTLKSGCSVEKLQIDDAWSLHNAIAVYYVVAWRLLHLTYLGRLPGAVSAGQVLDPDELVVLSHASGSVVKTATQAVLAIAKLGGYTHYRNAPPPGVKVLWLGLRYLQGMVEGYRLALNPKPLMNQA
jgi:hypothetical protein